MSRSVTVGDLIPTELAVQCEPGTMAQWVGDDTWRVTEVPQVETLSERETLAVDLHNVYFPASPWTRCGEQTSADAWTKVADFVMERYGSRDVDSPAAETAVVEAPRYAPATVFDVDGDRWERGSDGDYVLTRAGSYVSRTLNEICEWGPVEPYEVLDVEGDTWRRVGAGEYRYVSEVTGELYSGPSNYLTLDELREDLGPLSTR